MRAKTFSSPFIHHGKSSYFSLLNDNSIYFFELMYRSDESNELAPIFEELGERYKDSKTVIIAKFDGTANELDPKHPRIITFPTINFYKKGDNSVTLYNGKKSVESFVKFIESGGQEMDPDDEKPSDLDDVSDDFFDDEESSEKEEVKEEESVDKVEEDEDEPEYEDELSRDEL